MFSLHFRNKRGKYMYGCIYKYLFKPLKMNVRIVLKSTDSLLFHPSNLFYSFRVHLCQPLNLSGTWTISLAEFSMDPGKITTTP